MSSTVPLLRPLDNKTHLRERPPVYGQNQSIEMYLDLAITIGSPCFVGPEGG